ncbi:MAG TPA: hypothetical protein VMV35_08285 [Halothiobacillus sp.]|nr:hypothetical protein [Halothiobacillus sp.]
MRIHVLSDLHIEIASSKKNDAAVQHHALWDARCIRHAHRYALKKRIGGS